MFKALFDLIGEEFCGELAKEQVAAISRFHRIQASPGFRQAASYVQEALESVGIEAQILSFPADEHTRFWTYPSFQEWEIREATLHLVEPAEEARKLADFRQCPISLIQRSAPFDGEVEVVLLEDGEEEADYEGVDVTGKMVLTKGEVERVWDLAVSRRGAAGILFDGMPEAPPIRERLDLPDARQYTSFWWQPGDRRCFGFVLTPRQGEWLRALIRRLAREGKPPVKVKARVVSHFRDGTFEVVSARIPGSIEESEVLVVAHLCHPRPSANDNASGAAAVMEMARTLHQLIAQGRLPPPRRGIRFLWVPEMLGTYAYLATHREQIPHLVAGINLDMVGQNQDLCGSSFLLERPPHALPSFVGVLLERLREELLGEASPWAGGRDKFPLFRYATISFGGGSDQYILSDPTVGVPTPMLVQWPDRFYHTSFDTVDKVDPQMLKRAGVLAAAYAHFVATAGEKEATWLGHEMLARFKGELARCIQDEVEKALEGQPSSLERRAQHLLEREQEAFRSLLRLWPEGEALVASLQEDARAFTEREVAWAKQVLAQRGIPLAPKEPIQDRWEEEAARMVPQRPFPGPVPLRFYLRYLSRDERDRWHRLRKEHRQTRRILPTLAQYWADGKRTLKQIADLIELETGLRDTELLVEFFRFLAKLDLVKVERAE